MVARYAPWLALGGGGAAWTVHLFTGYFLVALGCPRAWPLEWLLAAITIGAAAASAGVGIAAVRARRRRGSTSADADGLLFGIAALLAGLFTVGILLAGVTAFVLSPCQAVAIGG